MDPTTLIVFSLTGWAVLVTAFWLVSDICRHRRHNNYERNLNRWFENERKNNERRDH